MASDIMKIVGREPSSIEKMNRRLEIRRNLGSNNQAFRVSTDLENETRAGKNEFTSVDRSTPSFEIRSSKSSMTTNAAFSLAN